MTKFEAFRMVERSLKNARSLPKDVRLQVRIWLREMANRYREEVV